MNQAKRIRRVLCDPSISPRDDARNRHRQVAAFVERTRCRGGRLIEPLHHHAYAHNTGGRHV